MHVIWKEALVATNSLRILTRHSSFLFLSFVLDVLSSVILLLNSEDNNSHDPKLFYNIRNFRNIFNLLEKYLSVMLLLGWYDMLWILDNHSQFFSGLTTEL